MSEDNHRSVAPKLGLTAIQNWHNIAKCLVLFAGLVLIVCLGMMALANFVPSLFSSARVTVTEKGAYVVEIGGRRTMNWLFAASSLWESTGIEVNKDDRIRIRASGKANLAIHHLVSSAKTDDWPYFHWTGPDGTTDNQENFFRAADKYRHKKRIATSEEVHQGALLMQIVPEGHKPQVRPGSEYLYVVGHGTDGWLRARTSGVMHFALNEVPLESDMEDYYVITDDIDPEYVKDHPIDEQKKAWEKIKEKGYKELWFDDNVGFFLLTIEVR